MTARMHKIFYLGLLVIFVLAVNYPVIFIDWMYPEEPLMYLVNQQIYHFSDLINVYLHPKLLHEVIPFFRPSGHFLIYQLLTPIIGWHQFRILTSFNLVFMALTGYYLIRLYSLLFKGYWVGGLIGFAIYLAHPSLFLVKVTVLHFEFAYTFFSAIGLYYFILFCKINRFSISQPLKMKAVTLLILSLLFYFIGVTFKESVLILGPVYAVYFCIELYHGGSLSTYIHQIIRNKKVLEFILLIFVVTILITLYITSAWPKASNPVKHVFTPDDLSIGIRGLFVYIFNWHPLDLVLFQKLFFGAKIYFGYYMSVIMIAAVTLFMSTAFMLFKYESTLEFKKSFTFLCIAALSFLILPLGWGFGYPWHFNLSLMMFGLLAGFSAEYLANEFSLNALRIHHAGIFIAICIGLTTIQTNIKQASLFENNIPPIHKAIFNPPTLEGTINNDSLLIVEDSVNKNAYALGAASYPFNLLYMANPSKYINSMAQPKNYFIPTDPNFSGSLFKWAYLNAKIKEQVVPYNIDHLNLVTSSQLSQWLQHFDNIFYISYDSQGNWHALTKQFKRKLLEEQKRRGLVVRKYH